MRRISALVAATFVIGLYSGVGCWGRADDHCGNQGGDVACVERGAGSYCSTCLTAQDGCTNEVPREECRPLDGSGIETLFHSTDTGAASSSSSSGDPSSSSELGVDGGGMSSDEDTASGAAGDDETTTSMSMDAGTGEGEVNGSDGVYSQCSSQGDCPDGMMCYSHFMGGTGGFCTYSCFADADCLPAASGDAHPICATLVLQCVLECDGPNDSSCPDGMICRETAHYSLWRCGWHETRAH